MPCPKRKKLKASHRKLGDLVSWSIPSQLSYGMAELLDDVVSEVTEYIQGHDHLVIVEGFPRSLAEKKDSLEHVNGGLADPCLKGSSFLLRVISIVTVIFVFVLDGRFVRVNASLVLGLSYSFPGVKLSARHHPLLQILRARPICSHSPGCRWSRHCRGSSLVRSNNVSHQSVVQWTSQVNGPCQRSRGSLANVGLVS